MALLPCGLPGPRAPPPRAALPGPRCSEAACTSGCARLTPAVCSALPLVLRGEVTKLVVLKFWRMPTEQRHTLTTAAG